MLDVLELLLLRVTWLEYNQDIELTDMEEMSKRFGLILRHVWWKHEGFELETAKEELDTIGLDYIIDID